MRAELDVTPEIDLTPKTAFKLAYEHFMTIKRFDSAHAVIERAKIKGVIDIGEWSDFTEDCLRRTDEHNAERFKTSDDVRALMGIRTAPYTK